MKFTVYQESRIGRRRTNEDRLAFCYTAEAVLMVVADGMGGHAHGELASQSAVDFIGDLFRRSAQPRLDDPIQFLSRALVDAHHSIVRAAQERRLPDVPRTTCVACVIQDDAAHWVHAGDSRLYLIRDGRVQTQTRDHSHVRRMIDEGLLDAEAAQRHPDRNRVYSCLGGTRPPQLEFSRRVPLQPGDILVLCSDGVWSPLPDGRLAEALVDGDVSKQVPRLLNEAEKRAGADCDNLTLVAVRWDEGDQPVARDTPTLSMAGDTVSLDELAHGGLVEADLSDDDIERAVEEIRALIPHPSTQESP